MGNISLLTLIHNYYENPNMLARHIENWRSYSTQARSSVRVVVVDDGSPTRPALDVVKNVGLPDGIDFRLYRVTVDIPWNWDGARNLAMRECTTEWAWMMDMDRMALSSDVEIAVALKIVPGLWYRPNQRYVDGETLNRPHPNCYIVSMDDFWTTCGHDEDFSCYYDKDKHFERRLAHVSKPIFVPEIFMLGFRRSDISDCDTRKGRKGSPYHMANAPAAMLAKAKGPYYVASNPVRFPWERVV